MSFTLSIPRVGVNCLRTVGSWPTCQPTRLTRYSALIEVNFSRRHRRRTSPKRVSLVPVGGAATEEGESIQVVAMSATFPAMDKVVAWLHAVSYVSTFRPVPLREYLVFNRKEFLLDVNKSVDNSFIETQRDDFNDSL